MPHEDSITKIKLAWSLYQNNISPEEIYPQLGIHRATMYRWLKGIKAYGIREFIRRYKSAKKGRRQPRKTNPLIKARIHKLREKYHNCCGEKIQYFLRQEYDHEVSVSTIYRILGERYQLRSKWKKYCKRGHIKKGSKPRESIQIDTVDLGNLYAFTAIDTFTKEADVVVKSKLTAVCGRQALKQHLKRYKAIEHLQRDGGSEFKREWNDYATKHISSIRTARPYKKNEQAYIERFNGILRKECVGYVQYKKKDLIRLQDKINQYLTYYHHKRPHLSLNMKTPNEFAMSHLT